MKVYYDAQFIFINCNKIKGGESMKGVVKFYNDRRRYGFITGEDDKDVFVHETGLEKQGLKKPSITEGDNVEYEIKESDRGPIAINVKKIEAEEDEGEKPEKPVKDEETEKSEEDQKTKSVKDEKPVEEESTTA